MSDKESNFSELFENSKTKQVQSATNDVQQPPARSAHYIGDIHFDIINPIPKSYEKAGVNRASLRQFKKNQDNLKARLDLHNNTREPAIQKLAAYIGQCQSEDIRYFLVIFGKGRGSSGEPVLKKIICSWMIACEEVLAYEFAKAKDGGDGAAYVMLRR